MDLVYLDDDAAQSTAQLLQSALPADGMTAFDLLQIEPCATAAAVAQAAEQISRRLAVLRQSKPSLVAQLGLVEAAVARIATALATEEQLDGYREALLQDRLRRFCAVVDPLVPRGRKPTEEERRRYRALAGELRLDAKRADEAVQEMAGVGVADTKYSRLGLAEVASDPTWPTAFDLLELSEDITDSSLIEAQKSSQRRKLEPMLKSPNMKDQRAARELIEVLNEAAAAILDPSRRSTTVDELTRRRVTRLREELRLAPEPVSEGHVLRLLSFGEGLRLPERVVRAEITAHTGFSDYMALVGADRAPRLERVPALSFTIADTRSVVQTTQDVRLTNGGGGVLAGRLSARAPWIQVNTPQFQITDVSDVQISVDANQLRPGLTCVGLVDVSSNGGDQLMQVQAQLVDLGLARTNGDRLGALLAYATVFTLVGPLLVLFVGERRSSYIAAQAAQASVLGLLLMFLTCAGLTFKDSLGFRDGLGALGSWLFCGMVGASVLLAVLSAIGLRIRVPYLWDYALRFVRVKEGSGPTTMRAGSR